MPRSSSIWELFDRQNAGGQIAPGAAPVRMRSANLRSSPIPVHQNSSYQNEILSYMNDAPAVGIGTPFGGRTYRITGFQATLSNTATGPCQIDLINMQGNTIATTSLDDGDNDSGIIEVTPTALVGINDGVQISMVTLNLQTACVVTCFLYVQIAIDPNALVGDS